MNVLLHLSGKEKILLFLLDHLEAQLHPPTKGLPPVIFSASVVPELINISQPLFSYSGETLTKEGLIEKKGIMFLRLVGFVISISSQQMELQKQKSCRKK